MQDTEQEQIQDLLQGSKFLRRTFEAIFDGILVVDRNGSIIYANPRAETLLGLAQMDLIGKKAVELPLSMYYQGGEKVPGKSRPFGVDWDEEGDERVRQVILLRPDGSALPVLFNINRMEGGPKVAVLTDSSVLMRQQQQAEEYYHLLAHDMRTPLTVIIGHADLLKSNPTSPEAMNRSLEAIHDAGMQLAEMTSEMGERLELESGHFTLKKEKIQLKDLLHEVVDQLSSPKSTHNLRVEASSLTPLEADPNRLKRLFINLVTNAIKYSPADSTITVSAWENAKGVMATVRDQGRGIEAEDLNYIFDPFFITSIGKQSGGIGLGLYISRLIVEAHEGRIYVCSSEEGTTFAVFLPKG
ncbi:MAG: sensor histidine kinase [Trichloromonadaceae bacterium]